MIILFFFFLFFLLLLANRLSSDQLYRRQHYNYSSDILHKLTQYQYGNRFSLLEEDVHELMARLHIDKSIILFNIERLRGICSRLLELHVFFRRTFLLQPDVAIQEPILNSKQMSLLLEFFLQMDGLFLFYFVLFYFIFIVTFSFSGSLLYENMSIS